MRYEDVPLFPLPPAPEATGPGGAAGTPAFPFAAPVPVAAVVAPDWAPVLAPLEPTVHRLAARLEEDRRAGHLILPQPANVLRAFSVPLTGVKVVIVGQDPYPTPGHSVGLAFSVDPATRPLPRSLVNIYKELSEDLGVTAPATGDLSGWTRQGVLLMNRVLTVRAGEPASHRGWGWEDVTDAALRALAERGGPLVAVLWGRDALKLKPVFTGVPTVESAHPSPLSASRGFFGSRPFSRVNALLRQQGADPVDWLAG
ncbi:uracil-DNA glycosylase [uncultured Arthrobacter sp.]|uniref:uracil-DNA glycosylase n=1 Tax=uncultured Arthrobacter sp. TaxID=114050 RepID=UPI0025DCDC7F|nr:uracil-DNA glycosylase [uncultured Arthrobacter sp.]